MMNILRSKMALRNESIPDLAHVLDISEISMYQKLNGKTPFKQREMQVIRQHYNLSDDEFMKIFMK